MKFDCPHCKEKSISLTSKYLAGKWATVDCPSCGGRSCANPYLLAVLYIFYIWDVVLFGYLAYIKFQVGELGMSALYVGVMLTGWLILDVISLYIPMSRMRPRPGGGR